MRQLFALGFTLLLKGLNLFNLSVETKYLRPSYTSFVKPTFFYSFQKQERNDKLLKST